MDKKNDIAPFWIGFVLAALAGALAYWYWRTQWLTHEQMVPLGTGGQAVIPPVEEKGGAADRKGAIEVEVRKKDQLQRITGIGPTYARRLNEAGIYSYAELARLTPEKLRELAGLQPWQGDPASWIEQAGQLAQEQ